ncbi:MAG: adenylyl-sulfate kinase [Nitrospiraceae bacterium]|nr:MAG: adenylyl-sulfate kinase [Nitrospiraceae bacterium]
MSWVIWITGLPGCGKSSVAIELKKKMPETVILNSDELRKIVTPSPTFSGNEREYVYKALVYTAKTVAELGHNVIIDATANRKIWREIARKLLPVFFEVYLKCPLDVCIEREKTRLDTHAAPKDIYDRGREGAPVPGLNVEYEEPDHPDLVIDSELISPKDAAKKIISMIQG